MAGTKKFEDSKGVLKYMKEYANDKELMVPLTSSLYVPGQMEDPENVLVEVGASYFIEQKNAQAQDYCQRRHDMLLGNARKINEILTVKKVQMQKVNEQLQKRFHEYQAEMAAKN